MKRDILIPLDGTKAAEGALAVLSSVCEKGDSVVLLSVGEAEASPQRGTRPGRRVQGGVAGGAGGGVADTPRPDVPVYAETVDQAQQAKIEELRDYLEHLAVQLRNDGYSVEVVADLSDNPADAITDYARKRKPTFIAMTRSAHRSLSQIAFGTVAQNVIRSDVAPVLLLPAK